MQEKVFKIRKAGADDLGIILDFIRRLADYEKLLDKVVATEELLREWMLVRGGVHCLIAEENGIPVGFALYFFNFSTFLGRGGLYLEDLFVLDEYRGRGYGKKLFTELASIAKREGCGRFEWSCLDWNKPSIDFYLSMGSHAMDEWTVYRIDGDELDKLAREAELNAAKV